jgi:hypothetical protein
MDPRVQAYIDGLTPWQQAICQRVRDLVHAADPEVQETIKRRVQPYFVLEGNICALLATKDHVNEVLARIRATGLQLEAFGRRGAELAQHVQQELGSGCQVLYVVAGGAWRWVQPWSLRISPPPATRRVMVRGATKTDPVTNGGRSRSGHRDPSVPQRLRGDPTLSHCDALIPA